MKCNFCGSEEIRVKTPYVELDKTGEYVPKETWCCDAQKKNQNYLKNHYTPDGKPDMEDIEKW